MTELLAQSVFCVKGRSAPSAKGVVMDDTYWWYVLFVKTNKENKVIQDVTVFYNSLQLAYRFEAFYLESEYYYRNKQERILGRHYRKRPLMPGYVFIETNMPAVEFLGKYSYFVSTSADIIKILKYNDFDEIALPEEERLRFEFLYRGKRCLEHSIGYITGDKIVVQGGPLVGREGLIKHINRHNREAIIEFEMFNQQITAKVALEIVSKTSE